MALTASFLESPIPPSSQESIARHFWGSIELTLHDLRPYFQYYTDQCRIAFHAYGTSLPIKTHLDILNIASDILNNLPRHLVKANLQSRYSGDNEAFPEDSIDACIDLTVRLLSMMDVGQFRNAYSGRRKLVWGSGSLQSFLENTFSSRLSHDHGGVKLTGIFNARNLDRIAGYKAQLTMSLSDHLFLRSEDKTVTIFHHASFLKSNQKTSLFPKGLVGETLQTLALLFPEGDRDTMKWYNKQDEAEELDHNVLKCGHAHRQIEEYIHWRDRLIVLKDAFDESRPSTISQWWHDRRDGLQWYALWVAISITMFFGLVQSVEGALQVYKAYHP